MPSVDIEGDTVTTGTAQRPPDDPIGLRPPDDPIGLRPPDEPIDLKDCEAYIERTALEAPPLPVQDEDDYI